MLLKYYSEHIKRQFKPIFLNMGKFKKKKESLADFANQMFVGKIFCIFLAYQQN